MKINAINTTLNLKLFYRFAKLNTQQKNNLLITDGVLLDVDTESSLLVKLYCLGGFFVEQYICTKYGAIVETIPYKQGYRISSFLKEKQFLVPKNNLLLPKSFHTDRANAKYVFNPTNLFQ